MIQAQAAIALYIYIYVCLCVCVCVLIRINTRYNFPKHHFIAQIECTVSADPLSKEAQNYSTLILDSKMETFFTRTCPNAHIFIQLEPKEVSRCFRSFQIRFFFSQT
jgi:hypothetical protein